MSKRRVKSTVRRLLSEQGLGESPPIPVDKIARTLGMELVERPGLEIKGEKVSGILLRTNGQTICIINGDEHKNRKRFTMAHEIGHYLLHPSQESYVDWNYYARDGRSSEGTHRREVEANAFAAELLMPEELVRAIVPSPLNVIEDDKCIQELARRFQVSVQAMTLRLTNLGLLHQW